MRLTLDECGILPRHEVLAALSGGADSVVLLHLLCAAGGTHRPRGGGASAPWAPRCGGR